MPKNRHREEFKCVGSFRATDQAGSLHTIEMWSRFDPVHDRDRSRVEPGQIALTTVEGYAVDRVSKGEYRLHDDPSISLQSDEPDAP